MKKLSYLIVVFLSLGLAARAQTSHSAGITAILDQMPATARPQFDQAMREMGALGQDGLEQLAAMLKPQGQADNTALQYALNGFAGYVMRPGEEAWRAACVQAYGHALSAVTGTANKQFLIRQLEIAGKDDAVPFITSWLADKTLVHPAAQALATIGTPAAEASLVQALGKATPETRPALIEALGDCRAKAATKLITPWAKSNDTSLRKVALYALANTADPASASTLRKAAADVSYRYSVDGATSDYLLFLQRLIDAGETTTARKLVRKLTKKTNKGGQQAVHMAAEHLSGKLQAPAEPRTGGLTKAEQAEGFKSLFDGRDLNGWTGNTQGYQVENGNIVVNPVHGSGGNLYTEGQYANFIYRFEFQLTPGANNGIGIRTPTTGDAAYVGMEIQVLDNTADIYKNLHPYQYHGSVYGVIPAKRGYLKPVGEWNTEEIRAVGPHIRVTLNGHVIVDGNIDEASKDGTADHKAHPGLKNVTGHIGFLGHGSVVRFRNIRIKTLGESGN